MNASQTIQTVQFGLDQYSKLVKDLKVLSGIDAFYTAKCLIESFPNVVNDEFYGYDFYADEKILDISSYIHIDENKWFNLNCLIDLEEKIVSINLASEMENGEIFLFRTDKNYQVAVNYNYSFENFFSLQSNFEYSLFDLVLSSMGLSLLPKKIFNSFELKDIFLFSMSIVTGRYKNYIPDQLLFNSIHKNIVLDLKSDELELPSRLINYRD
ncbi:TPA: hypothetical protein LUK61_003833, partial [Acinetobacter baumannii]|nr:hypothetical protein [Acinetobacter baumannii]HBM2026922.1 hypothetical protein [Acinetobacter baumannii]